MDPIGWLIVFIVLASGTTWLLLRHAVPRLAVLHRVEHPDVPAMVSSWLALAVVMPAVVLGARLGGPEGAESAAGAATGLPAAAALLGLGVAMIAGSRRPVDEPVPALGWATVAAAAGAALLALVLVTERHLTVWTGQAAFALLAVLLWISGPPRRTAEEAARTTPSPTVRREEMRCGVSLSLATVLAIGEGLALRGLLIAADAVRDAAGMADGSGRGVLPTVIEGTAILILAVRMLLLAGVAGLLPGALGRRAAAWIMAMGLFGAVGVAALVRLPGLVGTALRGEALPGTILAGGFGAWTGPATAALTLVAGLLIAPRGTAGRLAGAAAVAAGALVAFGTI